MKSEPTMSLHPAISSMLKKYSCETKQDYKNALIEIIQEVTLLGLSRHGFFEKASFYGGTALRTAHQLDRFSEDLEFELNRNTKNFELEPFLSGIDNEFQTYGLNLKTEKKEKSNINSAVDSAFIKGNTIEHLLLIEGIADITKGINKNDVLKIKIEIDIDPPKTPSIIEVKYHQNPIPFDYRILDLPSLFSGKLHAVFCRDWKGGRVKGRDFYDYLWYRKNKVEPNYNYLRGKLIQSGNWDPTKGFGKNELNELLQKKFDQVDWQQAKKDVEPFIRDSFALKVWSSDFFKSTV